MNASAIVDLVTRIQSSGDITSSDVLSLRRGVFGDERVWPHEAEALFDLSQKRLPACAEWQEFFLEAMTDYLVRQEQPQGYVSEQNAAWLIDMIERDGYIWTDTELNLVIHILEKATSSPPSLVQFAMGKVQDAVVSGEGPTRNGMNLKPGSIGAAEVDLLRRILYAFGAEGAAAVSRAEAEALFDINDATLYGDNDPAWQDLFVKAIANHLMALSGYGVPSREEAIRREAWLSNTETSVTGFFDRMVGGWRSALSSYEAPGRNHRIEAAINEKITQGEAGWLKDRMLRNGHVCSNQKALLQFIRDESPDVHPELRDLLNLAA
ncbi:MAG: hypothetical protein NWT00_06905 [Beijerinckiaceae bacterium]|jgi:hypothetical protein|nr:hypothetical protein [Beijerinckiaceae bacterium]